MTAAWLMALGAMAPQQDTAKDVRLMAGNGEGMAMVLSVDRKVLRAQVPQLAEKAGVRLVTDGEPVLRYEISAALLDGVALGSAWRVLGPGGEVACTVSGFGVIASEYFSLDDGVGSGMPCMEPLVFARMRCEGGQQIPHDAVAVPASSTRAAVAIIEEGRALAGGGVAAMLQLAPIQALQQRTAAQASDLGETLQVQTQVQAARLAGRQVQIVKGSFYTGEGEDYCGGEDIAAEWGGLFVEGAPIGFQAIDNGSIRSVFDLDGDGELELLQSTNGQVRLVRLDGTVIRSHAIEWCICGC